jgi:hypothetical protein
MSSLKERFNKWFEINFGWFFINGQKREVYTEYLKRKYGKHKNN